MIWKEFLEYQIFKYIYVYIYIYRSRCLWKSLNILVFIKKVVQMYRYELYYAKQSGKVSKHVSKWYPMHPDIYDQMDSTITIIDSYLHDYIDNM